MSDPWFALLSLVEAKIRPNRDSKNRFWPINPGLVARNLFFNGYQEHSAGSLLDFRTALAGFGDVDSDIDRGDVFYHINDGVLTHPYECELTAKAGAPAAVRVLSTGHARLSLRNGQVINRPRSQRARAHHRCPLRGGSGLTYLPKQEDQKNRIKALEDCRKIETGYE